MSDPPSRTHPTQEESARLGDPMPVAARFRFRPRHPVLAGVAAVMGAGLVVTALLDAPVPGAGVATGAGGVAIGGLALALALFYLGSPAWRTEIAVDDQGLAVTRAGRLRFRLDWTEVVRMVAAPASASAFIDGGGPARSLLLPGPGARAPYRIAGQRQLYDLIRARIPPERVVEVARLGRSPV